MSVIMAIVMMMIVVKTTKAAPAVFDVADTNSVLPVTEPWLEPCGSGAMVLSPRASAGARRARRTSDRHLRRLLGNVERMAAHMSEIAEELVTSYESLRFRDDEMIAVDLPNFHGLPDLNHAQNQSPREAVLVMSTAYEHMARLSIFVEVARYGEMTADHDRHHGHFVSLFNRLEADSSGGLYALMCGLSTIHRSLVAHLPEAALLGPQVVSDVRAIRVHRPSNHALRHVRDYTVATTLLRVARNLVDDLRQISEQHHR